MPRLKSAIVVCASFAVLCLLLVNVSAHDTSAAVYRRSAGPRSWAAPVRLDRTSLDRARIPLAAFQVHGDAVGNEGRRLFETETFGGNGRTCLTCHSKSTGTVSPEDAQQRFAEDPGDPLFVADGSDDGNGVGVSRMLADATILMKIPLHPNVTLKDDPTATFVTVRRGIPTTLNTPALDPVLMLDGRQPTLQSQAAGAIHDHAQNTVDPTAQQLDLIREFQLTDRFFSSNALRNFARGGRAPGLPRGSTASERRGRRFFDDLPPDPTGKDGLCSGCHSGPLLDQTNEFLPLAVPPGTRFQSVLVSELNVAGNPWITFVFRNQEHDLGDNNQDGIRDGIIEVTSPDPGRALITGRADDFFPFPPGAFDHLNAFKISPLRGIAKTAPYFHDNSAKTLEAVAAHYREFFLIVTVGTLFLDDQDLVDMVAFMKLL